MVFRVVIVFLLCLLPIITHAAKPVASSCSMMGSYWDEHDLDECWDETSDASFEFVAESYSE